MAVWVYRGGGVTHDDRSIERACELLLDQKWPKKTGRKYRRAIELVCEAAGRLDDADRAFADAAKDAGILAYRD